MYDSFLFDAIIVQYRYNINRVCFQITCTVCFASKRSTIISPFHPNPKKSGKLCCLKRTLWWGGEGGGLFRKFRLYNVLYVKIGHETHLIWKVTVPLSFFHKNYVIVLVIVTNIYRVYHKNVNIFIFGCCSLFYYIFSVDRRKIKFLFKATNNVGTHTLSKAIWSNRT